MRGDKFNFDGRRGMPMTDHFTNLLILGALFGWLYGFPIGVEIGRDLAHRWKEESKK